MKRSIMALVIAIVLIIAGIGGFFGYEYTHQVKTNLKTMYLTTFTNPSSIQTFQLSVMEQDLRAIGLPVSIQLVSPTVIGSYLTPNGTPNFVGFGWFPDWPDPVGQQLIPITASFDGGAIGYNMAWLDNSTLNSLYPQIMFETNLTQQMKQVVEAYHIIYNLTPYIWFPNPDTYFFVQPYVNNFTYNPYDTYFYNMMSYNYSYNVNGIKAPTDGVLTDVAADGAISPPDFLDPSVGFDIEDGPLFTAVYQQLVELNGTNYLQVVPVIASNYSVGTGTHLYQNYTFNIRKNVTFSNGDPVNATTVWFSFYRTIVMAQGPSVANYADLLFNSTSYEYTAPYSIPWGFEHAMRYVYNTTGKPSWMQFPFPTNYSNTNASNVKFAAEFLANMLSHFDPWSNATQAALISYTNQAVSVPGYRPGEVSYKVDMNTIYPYRFFLSDIAEWWGNIADPIFIDSHGGVTADGTNEYIDASGMPGTGPYSISAIGASLSSITLVSNPHYWGRSYWANNDLPAVAQPAHIPTLILDYGIEHSGRVSGFLDNDYQISYVSIPYISSIAGASPYSSLPLSSFFKNFGANPGVIPWSMNTQLYPTNILDFRKAVVYALNYSEIEHPYYYNSQYLAQNYIGPISPQFASYYDNATAGLSPQQYNITKAEYYLNLAGQQGKFFVTLPNGTILGDKALAKKYTVLEISGLSQFSLFEDMILSAETKLSFMPFLG
ncbi:hypothetical protein [Thermoplasma acidophilum]|uniref:Solute-binding protein family 5 domain-containing protein n=1 Tax=Thermoplasma acidophilum (strain ATCC 25905 / DSM 1728 / JCM 9062 / NBRC 15155 / AMRC-C165) TaxID=273075 RepID=Q9HLF3_THEAC|nr:ABC transporter substrate-binding protein [Thermoplasma acidophilum]CAC11420.1 hypothetical protein [Thermoplasma acidophilum]